MAKRFTIVVPSNNRSTSVKGLLDSLKTVRGLSESVVEVIVGDNDSADRSRLTEDYFTSVHRRQGKSRLVFKNHGTAQILFDLCRVSAQYGYYSIIGSERNLYRSKGRIYHYLGMLESKLNPKSQN